MPSKLAGALTLLMLTLAGAAPAQEPPLVRPGIWEVRSGSVGQPMVGYRLCLRSGSMDDVKLLLPRLQGGASCVQNQSAPGGEILTWELSCPSIPLSAIGRYVLKAESIEGNVEINTGKLPVQQKDMLSARYVGACPAN